MFSYLSMSRSRKMVIGQLPEHVQEQEDVGRVYGLPLCIQPDILTFLEEE